jgi:hypothetical protein
MLRKSGADTNSDDYWQVCLDRLDNLHRHIKNRRLAAVGPIWALSSLRASPGAADTSIPAAPQGIGTTKPNGTCSTSSSANFTTACKPVSPTTNTWRFHLLSLAA